MLFVAVLVLSLGLSASGESGTPPPRPAYTRASLHVARSLNPDAMQTLNVRTRSGEVATLLVKRRGAKSVAVPQPVSVTSSSIQVDGKGEVKDDQAAPSESKTVVLHPVENATTTEAPALANNTGNQTVSRLAALRSTPLRVVFGEERPSRPIQSEERRFSPVSMIFPDGKSPRGEKTVTFQDNQDTISFKTAPVMVAFADGAPLRGGKVSDRTQQSISIRTSPVTLHFGENPARSAKSAQTSSANVPLPVYVRSSPVYVAGSQDWKNSRSLMKIDTDGIPVIQGVRVPDDESDRQTWRNARVINNVLVPNTTPSSEATTTVDPSQNLVDVSLPPTSSGFKPSVMRNHDSFQPIFKEVPLIQKYDRPYDPYSPATRDRILEYINTINQREVVVRSDSQHISKPRSGNLPYNRRSIDIQNSYARDQNSIPTSQFQARVLQHPNTPQYPTSLLYSAQSTNTPSHISFEEGVRTPVLQYAHPELGVQPAKVSPKQEEIEVEQSDAEVQDNIPEESIRKDNTLTMNLFAGDIHSDRSPYAYEPGMESDEEKPETSTDGRSVNYRKSTIGEDQDSWSMNPSPYRQHDSYHDSYGYGSDKYSKQSHYNAYGYKHPGKDHFYRLKGHPSYGPGYYMVQKVEERPFWEKLGETIREHVQTGMERVQDLARPVVEPLFEATQKISHNLGFSRGNDGSQTLKERVGSAVAAYPVLLPALGLVAGGAALGLGAVAVGRYLDVDMMKRASDDDLDLEHKRAMDALAQPGQWVVYEEEKVKQKPEEVIVVVEGNGPVGKDFSAGYDSSQPLVRTKRHYKDPDVLSDEEQYLDNIVRSVDKNSGDVVLGAIPALDWNSTPCAKKMFCDVMVRQSPDALILMEKKIDTFLSKLPHQTAVAFHLHDAMDAVRRGDCSSFVCPAPR